MNFLKGLKSKISRVEQSPAMKYGFIIFTLLITPCVLTFIVEFIQRKTIRATLHWMWSYSSLLTLNILITFLAALFIYCLIGSLIPSIAVTVLLFITGSLISYFKIKLIGVPFFPWDLHMNRELIDILPLIINATMIKALVLLVLVIAFIFFLRFLLPRFSLPIVARIVLGLGSIGLLYLAAAKNPPVAKYMTHMHADNILWNEQQSYTYNGQALAFLLNIQSPKMSQPVDYSQATMQHLAKQLTADQQAIPAMATDSTSTQPNIIFYMNEAFWDPTLMTNVQFSQDPVPTVHELEKDSTSGFLLSPQYGGGTANVEFEILTGDSISFLPNGAIAYQQFIHKPLPSMANFFESLGYKSMVIHSYVSYFYNRENVYKDLGFESFKSSEDFINPEYKGGFISDAELARNIISEVDNAAKPMFLYAISMQNHGGYDQPNRYSYKPIKVTGTFTPAAQLLIDNYTQGANDASNSLQMLIDHYKTSNKPTIIIFYGDHLPMLGNNYDVYKQSGFVSSDDPTKWSLAEIKKMHSVPFVIWSNMNLPKEKVPILSDSFLGAYVMNQLQIPMPPTFAFNYDLSKKVPGLIANLVIDANHKSYASPPEALKKDVQQYSDLEFDEMFGDKYLGNYIDHNYFTQIVDPQYNLQFKKK